MWLLDAFVHGALFCFKNNLPSKAAPLFTCPGSDSKSGAVGLCSSRNTALFWVAPLIYSYSFCMLFV